MTWVGALLLVLTLALSGSASPPFAVRGPALSAPRSKIVLPPAHGRFSYQIGGTYAVPSWVAIVDRDRSAPAVRGKYSICHTSPRREIRTMSNDGARRRIRTVVLSNSAGSGRLINTGTTSSPCTAPALSVKEHLKSCPTARGT